MEFASGKNHESLSKIAGSDGHGEHSPYLDGRKAFDKDPTHPTHNPDGVTQKFVPYLRMISLTLLR